MGVVLLVEGRCVYSFMGLFIFRDSVTRISGKNGNFSIKVWMFGGS